MYRPAGPEMAQLQNLRVGLPKTAEKMPHSVARWGKIACVHLSQGSSLRSQPWAEWRYSFRVMMLSQQTTLIVDGCRGVDLHPGDIERAISYMEASGAQLVNSKTILE